MTLRTLAVQATLKRINCKHTKRVFNGVKGKIDYLKRMTSGAKLLYIPMEPAINMEDRVSRVPSLISFPMFRTSATWSQFLLILATTNNPTQGHLITNPSSQETLVMKVFASTRRDTLRTHSIRTGCQGLERFAICD